MLRQRLGSGYVNTPNRSTSPHLHEEKLKEALEELFPDHDILHNVRKQANLVSPVTRSYLELDAWIPALNLAFEFQDPHHYVSTWYENSPLSDIQFQDSFKKTEAERLGITIVAIPCWWDGSKASLVGTIKSCKSTLLSNHSAAPPIPPEPPPGFFTIPEVKGVGQPMLASFPESAQFDPTHWWMSEKYDGVRAIWSPKAKILYSRHSKRFEVPVVLTKWFSDIFLDSELWFGRDTFQQAQQIVKNAARLQWSWGRVVALDYPAQDMHAAPYEERYSFLMQHVVSSNPLLILLACQQCPSKNHVQKSLRFILDTGGEGLVIRRNKSTYQPGRSASLLKFKAARDDEGVVLEIKGDTYSLQLRDESVIIAKASKHTPPPEVRVGDVATFSYLGPNQVVVDRKRDDVQWNLGPTPQHRKENKPSLQAFLRSPTRPRGYWTMDGNKNIRKFMDNLAYSKNLDPLVPETWYSIPLRELRFQQKGKEWPLFHYSSSSVKALMDIYPDIGLDESKFTSARKDHWKVHRNRRLFFDKFAERQGFSATSPENWYHVNRKLVLRQTGGQAIIKKFDNLTAALIDAYPNLAFDVSKFTTRPPKNSQSYWRIRSARRDFFDQLAQKKKIDPLVPSNWYSLRNDEIFAERGAASLLDYYQHSFVNALIDVYPTVSFDETKFDALPMSFYKLRANRKKFFDSFAQDHGFNPTKRKAWNQYLNLIMTSKGGRTILSQYGTAPTTNLLKALRDIYQKERLISS